jgi:Glycosyl transferase family 2/Glycosyl transferases group 1
VADEDAWAIERRRSGRRGRLRRSVARVRRDRSALRHLPAAVLGVVRNSSRAAPETSEVLPGVVLPVLPHRAAGPVHRPDVLAGVVVDAIVAESLRPEWRQLDLTPQSWLRLVEGAHLTLVLIQASALDQAWPVEDLVAWCRAHDVPVVLWADIDQESPAVDHVVSLQAWAQPRLHRPIRWGPGRTYGVAADATVTDTALAPLLAGAADLGERVDRITPAWRLAAQTAFRVQLHDGSARRLVELAASATPVLSAAPELVESLFGAGIVPVATSAAEAAAELAALLDDADLRDRLGQLSHRLVLDGHTAGHRVESLIELAGADFAARATLPTVSVVVPTNRAHQIDHVLAQVARQTYPKVQLVVALHGTVADPEDVRARARAAGIRDVSVVVADASLTLGAVLNAGLDAADGDLVAKVDDDNLYGSAYLTDLVRAVDWAQADVVGKWAHHVWLEGTSELVLRFAASEHRFTDRVQGGTMVIRREVARRLRFDDVPRAVDTRFLRRCDEQGLRVYSADRWNFVSVRRPEGAGHTWTVSEDLIRGGSSTVVADGAAQLVDPLAWVTV